MPKIVVAIEWDEPDEPFWLNPDNVSIALHAHCKNTRFKVTSAQQPLAHERWSSLANGESGEQELEEKWLITVQELFQLWQERQRKYGTGNISAFMELGCLVRASDKVARLKKALVEDNNGFSDETVKDSWMDLANYAIMGLMCHRNIWPKT